MSGSRTAGWLTPSRFVLGWVSSFEGSKRWQRMHGKEGNAASEPNAPWREPLAPLLH